MLLSLWITILLCQLCLGLDCWVCHLNLRGSPNTCYDNHMGILEKCNYTKPLCVMKAKKKLFYKQLLFADQFSIFYISKDIRRYCDIALQIISWFLNIHVCTSYIKSKNSYMHDKCHLKFLAHHCSRYPFSQFLDAVLH